MEEDKKDLTFGTSVENENTIKTPRTFQGFQPNWTRKLVWEQVEQAVVVVAVVVVAVVVVLFDVELIP